MSRPRKLVASCAASMAAAALVALPGAGAAGFGGTFKSVAAADGIRATLIAPGVTVVKSLVDAGTTSTQATLNSLGESRAFASIPYPGDLVIVGPGTVAGATNGQVNLPNYPLYAWSDHPARPGHVVGDGPLEMRAESNEVSSSGEASAGLRSDGVGQLGLSRTDSSIRSEGEAVTAAATSEITAFKVGPLEIGQVVSLAEAVFDRSGTLQRKADSKIVGVSVAGTPVELSPAGVNAAGSVSPPPDMQALNEALEPAGLTVELVPARQTDTGVVAPAVRVTQQLQQGSQLIYQLGSAAASVEGTADATAVEDDVTGGEAEGVGGPDQTAGPSGSAQPGPPSGAAADNQSGPAEAPAGAPADPAPAPSAGSSLAPPAALATAGGTTPSVSYPFPAAGTVTPPSVTAPTPEAPAVPAEQAPPPALVSPSNRSGGDEDGEVAAVPVLASRLLDGGDTRPFYAAFVVAAIVGLAGVVGVALFSRALRSGV